MKQYKIILLDVDGTLLDFDKAEEQGIGFLLRTYGVPETEENKEAYHKLNQSYWRRMERGELTRDQARNHPHKNLITRALGVAANIVPEYNRCEIEAGDILLLCTDGLTNMIPDSEIARVLKEVPFFDATSILVDRALQAGGQDNITVLLMGVETTEVNNG